MDSSRSVVVLRQQFIYFLLRKKILHYPMVFLCILLFSLGLTGLSPHPTAINTYLLLHSYLTLFRLHFMFYKRDVFIVILCLSEYRPFSTASICRIQLKSTTRSIYVSIRRQNQFFVFLAKSSGIQIVDYTLKSFAENQAIALPTMSATKKSVKFFDGPTGFQCWKNCVQERFCATIAGINFPGVYNSPSL